MPRSCTPQSLMTRQLVDRWADNDSCRFCSSRKISTSRSGCWSGFCDSKANCNFIFDYVAKFNWCIIVSMNRSTSNSNLSFYLVVLPCCYLVHRHACGCNFQIIPCRRAFLCYSRLNTFKHLLRSPTSELLTLLRKDGHKEKCSST